MLEAFNLRSQPCLEQQCLTGASSTGELCCTRCTQMHSWLRRLQKTNKLFSTRSKLQLEVSQPVTVFVHLSTPDFPLPLLLKPRKTSTSVYPSQLLPWAEE